jgi:hypothetical protein
MIADIQNVTFKENMQHGSQSQKSMRRRSSLNKSSLPLWACSRLGNCFYIDFALVLVPHLNMYTNIVFILLTFDLRDPPTKYTEAEFMNVQFR